MIDFTKKQIMMDMETLGTTPHSVILTIGLMAWYPYDKYRRRDTLLVLPDTTAQEAEGRKVDFRTISWWMKQSDEAKEEAFTTDGRIHPASARSTISDFFRRHEDAENVWCRGSDFDGPLLVDFLGSKPFPYWKIADMRTAIKLAGTREKEFNFHPCMKKHTALGDCWRQTIELEYAVAVLHHDQARIVYAQAMAEKGTTQEGTQA